jgi:hypothetical protein
LDFSDIYYKYKEKLKKFWSDDESFLKDIYKYNFYKYCKLGGKYKETKEYHNENRWI